MDNNSGLVIGRDEHVWTFTINRAHRRNALDNQTIGAMMEGLAAAESDPKVTGIVIAGGGDVAFCAGSDLKAVAEMTQAEQLNHAALGQKLMAAIEASPCITIAAVNGYALGGGFELALACDLIVAGDTAQFGLPELRSGMIPAWGGTFRLSRAIGLARARAILLGGKVLSADAALDAGVVVETVPASRTVAAAQARASELASYAPRNTIKLAKHLLTAGTRMDSSSASMMEHLAETVQSYSDSYGVRK